MANPIDVTITSEALKQVKDLYAEVKKAQEAFLGLSQDALNASKNISKISTPSELKNSSNNNVDITEKVKQQSQSIISSQDKIQKAYERARIAEIRLQQQREKAVDNYSKSEQKSQQMLSRSENTYNKVQKKVQALTATYNNLATKKELGLKLDAREVAQLANLETRLNRYQNVLKKVDADIGKYNRNVGNYASGWNGLSNSINQLTREAPAFAVSASTGFLALSNNIPALFDEIGRLKEQNRSLADSGEEPLSILEQLKDATFSWQTVLSVGVTLLTIYGGEIIEWAKELLKGKEAIDTTAESLKLINDASLQGTKNAQQELIGLKSNLEIAKDVNLSYKERSIAVDNLQKQYPFYFDNLTREQILAGETAKAERDLTLAILSRAKASAAITKITENQSEIIDLDEIVRVNDIIIKQEEKRLQESKKRAIQIQVSSGTTGVATTQETFSAGKLNIARGKVADATERLNELNAINNRLIEYALANEKQSIGLDYEKEKSSGQSKRKQIEGLQKVEHISQSVELWLKKMLKAEQDLLEQTNNPTERKERIKDVEFLEEALKALNGTEYMLTESAKKSTDEFEKRNYALNSNEENIKKLTKATNDYIKSFSDGFLKDAGLGSLDLFLKLDENGKSPFDKLLEETDTLREKFQVTFLAISESAQEAFNFINQASQQNFDAEYKRLEMQKNVAIQFAGDSTTAQEKINEEYERRKKEIQRREAETKKRQAVFNILIDTAQAVVSALPNIALSIIVGAIGLAQAAIVQSQQIPQFFDGGTHKGGVMMVNDAKGNSYKETIVTPDGKIIKPQGRNVLMNAPAGTEIFTPEQWKEKEKELGNILSERGISFNPSVMRNFAFGGNSGLTKTDFDNGINTLSKTIRKMPSSKVSFDEKGYRKFLEQDGKRTERLNRRFNIR